MILETSGIGELQVTELAYKRLAAIVNGRGLIVYSVMNLETIGIAELHVAELAFKRSVAVVN